MDVLFSVRDELSEGARQEGAWLVELQAEFLGLFTLLPQHLFKASTIVRHDTVHTPKTKEEC